MFGWFTRRRQAAKRQIFSFYDGSRRRYADPLLIRRKLIEHPTFKWDVDPLLVDNDDVFGRAAYRVTLAAIREIFDVQPLSEGFIGGRFSGLTEQETFNLWLEYVEFLVKKNVSANSLPTSPPSTPSTSTDSTTGNLSDCSSIKSGSIIAAVNP